jgi:hypothetical protein
MLIGNYSVINKFPGRRLSGTSTCDRSAYNQPGASVNFYFADFSNIAIQSGTQSTYPLFSYSRQIGYAPPYSWNISPKSGGMGMSNYSSSSISLNLIPTYPMLASLTGTGELTPTIYALGNIICALTGSSSYSADVNATGNITCAVTGIGTITANMTGQGNVTIDFTGSSQFTATASLFVAMLCDLTGNGTLTADMLSYVSMLCDLTGGGTLTANLAGQKELSASLTGTGDLAADIKGFGNMIESLIGSGSLNAGVDAIASMSVDIVVTGTGLTTANVGSAVWNQLIEGGYTADDLMKLMSSALVGKLAGGATTTNTIRDINDTVDRIIATVDADGNRTTVTKNVS